jgi:hypothetical protein
MAAPRFRATAAGNPGVRASWHRALDARVELLSFQGRAAVPAILAGFLECCYAFFLSSSLQSASSNEPPKCRRNRSKPSRLSPSNDTRQKVEVIFASKDI